MSTNFLFCFASLYYIFFVFKSFLTMPSNVLPLHLNQTFPPLILIFTEGGEGDGIKSRLSFKIFSILMSKGDAIKKSIG